ncbi:hypothetical protein ACIQLG_16410 [Terribacillus saccharophilus]|uniref:hypothetical protein n=1 Tax=Terribacillus saccharophilus TaxID=361277 RepID=UPI0038041447
MSKEKKKKPFYKKWWVWLIAIIVVAAAAGGAGSDDSADSGKKESTEATAASAETTKEETKEDSEAETEEEAENTPKMTKDEFSQIKNGMTIEEVTNIVGGEGDLMSETGAEGDQFYTALYTWEGEGGFGANANITFQGNPAVVQSKAQLGLDDETSEADKEETETAEAGSSSKMSKDEFGQIKNGMTVEEVTNIVGGEGDLMSETGTEGDQFYTALYTWEGEGGFGANANITFQGDPAVVQSKAQLGLE